MFAWWIDAPDVAAVKTLAEVMETFSAKHLRVGGFNFVTATKATQFTDETRRLVAEIRAKHAPKQLAIATVIEGDGFRAAAVRAVASGLNMLSREPFPSKNFDTLEDAVPWFASLAQVDAGRLSSAAKRFRFAP